ncbi:hypothetical protein [Ferrovibrio sp.]|uniref:hypothetical protein n=1 Tax=Ferrovibrio sp. TaxID=1917215 RepID=UPI000CC7F2C2|nr:hypothetical protein [Ferrovibrio sp.]PJI43762.1 MAG: hypothetical protein CTR53_01755 [Ferrovibrio sp.]
MNSYLVTYDYGSAGLWAIIKAPDKASIAKRFPKVEVLEDKPGNLTAAEYGKLITYDLGGPLPQWLAELEAK